MTLEAPPSYPPVHKAPTWLSSVEVHAAIRECADSGVDKAACWDFTQAIYRLTERTTNDRAHLLAQKEHTPS